MVTELSGVQFLSEIILVISKNDTYDFRPNCTPLSSITIIKSRRQPFSEGKKGKFRILTIISHKNWGMGKTFSLLAIDHQIQGACHRADKEIPDLRNSANDTEISCKSFWKTRKWLDFRNVNLSTERLRNREKKMGWNETEVRCIQKS